MVLVIVEEVPDGPADVNGYVGMNVNGYIEDPDTGKPGVYVWAPASNGVSEWFLSELFGGGMLCVYAAKVLRYRSFF